MRDAASTASEAIGNTLRVVPVAVGGSTILGYSWSEFVNVLASVSIALQIAWFIYDKVQCIRKEKRDG